MTTDPFITPGVEYDYDQAACALIQALGLYDPQGVTFGDAKWVFCSNNPVGNAVRNLLEILTEAGILTGEKDGHSYRLADEYDPTQFGKHCAELK